MSPEKQLEYIKNTLGISRKRVADILPVTSQMISDVFNGKTVNLEAIIIRVRDVYESVRMWENIRTLPSPPAKLCAHSFPRGSLLDALSQTPIDHENTKLIMVELNQLMQRRLSKAKSNKAHLLDKGSIASDLLPVAGDC